MVCVFDYATSFILNNFYVPLIESKPFLRSQQTHFHCPCGLSNIFPPCQIFVLNHLIVHVSQPKFQNHLIHIFSYWSLCKQTAEDANKWIHSKYHSYLKHWSYWKIMPHFSITVICVAIGLIHEINWTTFSSILPKFCQIGFSSRDNVFFF